ncbi:beta strand repeat-containing protein [Leucothrix arctica]|uniref:DUF11 domain-containing protein n=1 Tax=Leucothrix arctica TaxID=1481894 RepID=A0A317CJN4_9GAMM|nr:DUF11 domain-containing protein [Leucothrix arctica]PWQ98795.1 hypothetical protein DKT75_03040 [Leucothrix arctica]
MKTKNQMKPLARLIATSLAVGTMAGFGAQAFAATAAGTLIKNLATVTYEDENGNEYSAQSNEAVVTVAPVPSATVENDNSLTAAPGQTVYFPHTVSNTGNTADSYSFAADAGVVYHDVNNNGQPDPGEPALSPTDLIEVAAGEKLHVVVALPIDTDAVSGDTFTSKLTTTAASGVVVDDIGDNGDTTEATVDNVATVTTGPVLVLNKSSVHNEDANTITYTLTVKNNGSSAAEGVKIVDALPQADSDNSGSIDGVTVDPQLALATGSTIYVQGLVNTADGDIAPTTTSIAASGHAYGDLNTNGVTGDDDNLLIILAEDASLPANTEVSVTYTVQYNPDDLLADDEVENTFYAFYEEDDGDPTTDDTVTVPSNTTVDVIPQTYGVEIEDTGDAAATDGADDDGAENDIQHVTSAATGSVVLFTHEVTNDGNGDDIFNLDIDPGTFPTGTVFTFWDATGTVQLTDTDNDGIPDTGVIGPDQLDPTTIVVKADLPAGVDGTAAGGDPFTATITATSSEDPDASVANGSVDTATLTLGVITEAQVDIANVTSPVGSSQGDTVTPSNLYGFNDDGSVNAQDEGPVVLADAVTGGKVVFDLILANESGNPDSFTLSSDNVPTGWDVVFKDLSGNVITTTTLVPGGGEFAYTAEVTVSSDPAEAKSDSDRVGDVDGYDSTDNGSIGNASTDAGTDTDNDYQISFSATSTSTAGLSDTVTNAVDVAPEREVAITPNGQNQIQAGGTVDYGHKLENNGNQTEAVELTVDNSNSDWSTIINVDTNGDGTPDSVLSSLVSANPGGFIISGVDEDGAPVDIEVTVVGGVPVLNLEPGENVDFTTTVSSPSNAPAGATDLSTITAVTTTPLSDPLTVTAEDNTTVVDGQVRLDKSAAIDANCDGDADDANSFAATQSAEVEPGQCVVWELTATNESSTTVKNVVISDAAPEYTFLVQDATNGDGTMKYCHGNGCLPVVGSADAAYDAGTGVVTFEVGDLIAGQTATGQFTVEVE